MSSSRDQKLAHVALLPSAGMGHLTPFLRLAALLTARNVQVTFITPHPTVSLTESQALSGFFASFPQVKQKQFHLLPLEENSADPFFYHMQLIKSSCHLLSPLLSALTPSLSGFITDMTLASTVIPITQAISLPNYVLFTSSAKMMTLFLSYSTLAGSKALDDLDETDVIKIRNVELMPKSLVPPPLLQKSNNLLKNIFIEDGRKVIESCGILLNTFVSFELESLTKINDGQVLERLPSVVAIGPLPPCDSEKSKLQLTWLDDQPAGSVLYVSFGSRTALARDQIRELGEGLIKCGSRFVWVVKDKKVDREDSEELEESWGWSGEMLVKGAEIAERIRESMGNESLRIQALGIKEDARKAVGFGGSSYKGLTELISMWKHF
ncbi:hypothetical protein H0E87_028136 [Populus deltoides]|uniref:Uncharacterized protein n=1 Tax=Populus deltoides TaxID=3696 RepID=A0A8T2WQL5_POPDE|nr:hypothetical protein H0E87_028136 [Populus deltoides]